MDIEAVVRSLDGEPLERLTDTWLGAFEGSIRVVNVERADGSVRFEILIPTSASDIDDFIWERERASGTTDKIVLRQREVPVPGATVVSIDREGDDKRWTASQVEQYRITFDLPIGSAQPGIPLSLLIRWPEQPTAEDVAIATGRLN